ncbi:MAG: hypothetical protein PHI87_06690, partial [Candidatus Methanomethylophilus sp.]|nr:hypothetical protein [Methanomethylophilus sp.]
HIMALDNGTFGSTGNQISPAYETADIGMLARAAGISSVERAVSPEDISRAVAKGTSFVHLLIRPGNSASPNISLSPEEIRSRTEQFIRETG